MSADPSPVPLPPVGVTGLGVAVMRAAETRRPDRLFDDPYAEAFVRAAGLGARLDDEALARRPIASWVAVRTRFLDEVVLEAISNEVRQVVILGAGLDTRAYRLPWPEGTHLWELDLPDVLAFKERVIRDERWTTSCTRVTVPVDLSIDWGEPLVSAGFNARQPAAWIAEGLLAYLTPAARDALVACTAALSTAGSTLGLTVADPGRLQSWRDAHPDGPTEPRDYVALWRSDTPDDVASWLRSFGWDPTLYFGDERSAAYGRPAPEDALASAHPRLVHAVRVRHGGPR